MSVAAAEVAELMVVPGTVPLPALQPLGGLLAGALIMSDRRQWRRLAAAACGAMLLSTAAVHGRPVLPSLAFSLIVGLEAWAVAWVIGRTTASPFALNRVAHTSRLVVASTLVPAAGGAFAAIALVSPDLHAGLAAWRSWWLADSIGLLLVAPMAIAAIAERDRFAGVLRSWTALEMAVVFGGAFVVAQGIFGEAVDPVVRVPAYMLPFLIWPVFRFGPGRTCAMLFLVSLSGLWHAGQGLGPLVLRGAPAAEQVLRSQGAAVISAVSLLLLASVVAERTRIARENLELLAQLQQALAEVKTLRGFIPICAWCHKVRDDAGFWQRIEQYLDTRTDATFSHSICPACAEAAHDDVERHHLTGRTAPPYNPPA